MPDTKFTWEGKDLTTASSVVNEMLNIEHVDTMMRFLQCYYKSTTLSKIEVIKNIDFGLGYFCGSHMNYDRTFKLFKESLLYFIKYD